MAARRAITWAPGPEASRRRDPYHSGDIALALSLHKMAERFRRAREETGLTLRELADRAGVAASSIQKVESGKMVPTVAVMVRLADALNRRPSYFIEDGGQAPADIQLVPVGTGQKVGDKAGLVRFERIAEPLTNPRMEAFRVHVRQGGRSGGTDPIIYRGEEVVICTRGTLIFQMRGQEHKLGAGDTLHFKGDIPHTWHSPGPDEAEMIMVCAFTYS